jgi:hypothetical protein
MKVQMIGSYPCIAGMLPTTPALLTNPLTLAANHAALFNSPLLRAPKVHVFSSKVASQSPSREKLLNGLRAFSDLITPHCGQKVAIGASAIWLGVDTASAVRTVRDPQSCPEERLSAAGAVSSDACALFAGILGSPHLDQAANAINFATVVGDHVHTGQITFSQSELAQFSSDPQSDDISNILKLTEVFLPPDTP